MSEFKSIGTGYFYRIVNGKFMVSAGEIQHSDGRTYWNRYQEPECTIFITRNKRTGKINTREICAETPGEVRNGKVWLEEPDKKRAVQLLIEYEENEIEKVKRRADDAIARHSVNIDILTEEE